MYWFVKIGNTNTTAWDGDRIMKTLPTKEIHRLDLPKNQRIWVSSVVPLATRVLKKKYKKLKEVRSKDVPLRLAYTKGFGVDRALNLFAAAHLTRKSFLVMDVGTAITVDFFDVHIQKHLGGWISAGPDLLAEILSNRTALLPKVLLRTTFKKTLGKSTHECLKLGQRYAVMGHFFMAKEIANELLKKFEVFVTGGNAWVLKDEAQKIIPDLGLLGLKYFSQRKGFL